ncbi:unnamed protein product [Lymnaea stagnalis]|uniref:CUB domain-containing protein n=1 Tax=Lymnaea stagnalis TaxID=6523 RepID=A0AAV2H6N7_LYMST
MFHGKMFKDDLPEGSSHVVLLCWIILVVLVTAVEGDAEGDIKDRTSRKGRTAEGKTNFVYMTNYCTKTLQVNQSVLVALTPKENLAKDRNKDFVSCYLDLNVTRGMGLFIHFLQLGISSEHLHSDHVHLYSMNPTKKMITPKQGLFGRVDRSLALLDDSGSGVGDYKIPNNSIRIDYLGIPTMTSPGFRLLITAFYEPTSGGECRAEHMLCPFHQLCIPRRLACDGNFNCGKDDRLDEKGCDREDTVTDILANYSLARDILLVILLPLVVFLLVVVVSFTIAKKYIRLKILKPPPPSVIYTQAQGGRVTISDSNDVLPPTYEDVMHPISGPEPPPAYSTIIEFDRPVEHRSVFVDHARVTSERVQRHSSKAKPRLNSSRPGGSASSVDDFGEIGGQGEVFLTSEEYEAHRLHGVWPSDTDDDDDDIKEKRRRKGGKSKSSGKRRTHEDRHVIGKCKLRKGSSPVSSNSSQSVPCSHSADSFGPVTSHPFHSHRLPNASSEHQIKDTRLTSLRSDQTTRAAPSSSDSVICVAEISSESLKSRSSSGGEPDRKSETESRFASKRNSVTESLTSLHESAGLKADTKIDNNFMQTKPTASASVSAERCQGSTNGESRSNPELILLKNAVSASPRKGNLIVTVPEECTASNGCITHL